MCSALIYKYIHIYIYVYIRSYVYNNNYSSHSMNVVARTARCRHWDIPVCPRSIHSLECSCRDKPIWAHIIVFYYSVFFSSAVDDVLNLQHLSKRKCHHYKKKTEARENKIRITETRARKNEKSIEKNLENDNKNNDFILWMCRLEWRTECKT